MASRHYFHPYNGDVVVKHPFGVPIPEGCRVCDTPTQRKSRLCFKHDTRKNKGGCRR